MSATVSAAAAAALYAGGLLMLFVIRSHRHKAATGSSGFNGFTKTPGAVARVAGVCFAVAVVVGLLAPIIAAVETHRHDANGSATEFVAWVGLALTAVGFATAVVAQNTMGVSWRIGVDQAERTELITHGVFARVRNPIFTAMIAAQAGTALMAPTWLSLLGVLLLLAGIELQVRSIEEPYLARIHNTAYLAYAAHTGRFLPGLGRLTHPPQPVQTRKETLS